MKEYHSAAGRSLQAMHTASSKSRICGFEHNWAPSSTANNHRRQTQHREGAGRHRMQLSRRGQPRCSHVADVDFGQLHAVHIVHVAGQRGLDFGDHLARAGVPLARLALLLRTPRSLHKSTASQRELQGPVEACGSGLPITMHAAMTQATVTVKHHELARPHLRTTALHSNQEQCVQDTSNPTKKVH